MLSEIEVAWAAGSINVSFADVLWELSTKH